MTPEEMRVAIAEACPDIFRWNNLRRRVEWIETDDETDPLEDLNAMHEAEKYAAEHLMNADQWEQFGHELEKAHPTACVLASGCDLKKSPIDYYDLATLITGLSATQHAEAFCKTLWPERFK